MSFSESDEVRRLWAMDSIDWYISFHRLSILPAAANMSRRSDSQSQLGMIKSECGYMIFVEIF